MYLIFVVLDAVPGRGEYAGTAQPAGRPGGGDSPTQHSAGHTQERAPCQLISIFDAKISVHKFIIKSSFAELEPLVANLSMFTFCIT